MVTSMIPSVDNIFVNKSIVDMRFLSAYNPLINYDWSTTTTSGLRYLKDIGSTPTYDASMYFGIGAYLNGADQTITVPINTTIQTALKRVNGIVTINETSQILTNYVISGVGVHKDYYLFTRLLTTAEKDSYTNTPELFYAMAQADSTCLLNMPMCETSSTARNYKTGIDNAITNYTSSVRDNAKNLRYGLQTCKFVRDSLGVIQGASNYLECDGAGYGNTGWIPNVVGSWSVEIILKVTTKNDVGAYSFKGIGIHSFCSIKMFNYLNGSLNVSIGLDHFNNYGCFSILQEHFVHIVVVNNSNIFTVYLNKVLIGTTTKVNKASTPNQFFIGSVSGYVNTQALNEPMRQFKLHNKELTQAEITENYNSYVAKGLLS